MHILLINRSDQRGGAAVVTRRLACAMQMLGSTGVEDVEVRMLVQEQLLDDADGMVRSYSSPLIDRCNFIAERLQILVNNGLRKSQVFLVDTAAFGRDLASHEWVKWADVIVLGWVNQSAMSMRGVESLLRTGKQVVWVLHDLWPITGVCHLPYECAKYQHECGECKYLNSSRKRDLSTRVFKQKKALYQRYGNLMFVAVSHWVKECCMRSALVASSGLRCEVIPNALPIDVFASTPRTPDDSIVMTMGAARLDDPIKGFPTLIEALAQLKRSTPHADRLRLVLYGSIRNKALLDEIPIPYIYKGVLPNEHAVAEVYAESDIVLSCSAYETFGATLAEGIASGCLAVTKGTGGQCDIVDHQLTGYIVEEGEPFSSGLLWAVNKVVDERQANTVNAMRQQRHDTIATRFAANAVATRFMQVIKDA